ncbi:MAG: chemotaxis protein CheR [Magnetococcales bacterium]|nr:chemotaxis protein CheR [Magnetococcales bacterium]MBF0321598.1 chemotaxis protein CheR [Magnetococcales bacterium]
MNAYDAPSRNVGLSDKDFKRLSDFIYQQAGILMPMSKKTMLTARIQKRLRTLHMGSFEEYVELVLDPHHKGEELIHFIDAVTTNKTDFFRESNHFEYLKGTVLPELVQTVGAGLQRRLMVWSAACSTGEEPYTLAMVIKEFGVATGKNFNANILATDLSTKVLKKAAMGIYEMEKVAPVPMHLKKKYMLKNKNPQKPMVKMGEELRSMIRFQQLNFMDADYRLRDRIDVIFCRNAIIYFDRPTTEAIVNKFCRHLIPGGYLFVGHSETLNNLKVPLVQVAPTIYQLPK